MSKIGGVHLANFTRLAASISILVGLAGIAGTAIAQSVSADLMAKAEANFKKANASGGGKLNAAEFKAFIDLNAADSIGRAPKIVSNNAYERAFGTVDADKDGAVTWAEFVKAQAS